LLRKTDKRTFLDEIGEMITCHRFWGETKT
jgi:hypothetical protein